MSINKHPLETVDRLVEQFKYTGPLLPASVNRSVPVGVEVEVAWRSFFPDLWVEGFPNVDSTTLAKITNQCTVRERELIPRLMQTVECGVQRGTDRYWEFAFAPVLDVSIVVNQIAVLRHAQLIPPGQHSLHITFGGIQPSRDVYCVLMILEAFASTPERIMSAFHPTDADRSVTWGKKGRAGIFEKTGSHDLMHGYEVGSEVRTLLLPEQSNLMCVLTAAQRLIELVHQAQVGKRPPILRHINDRCSTILARYGLPDVNWERPHQRPDVWRRWIDAFDPISSDVRALFAEVEHQIP